MTKEIHDINTRALDFVVELIDYIFEYHDDDYMTMECLCRKLYKHGLIDKKDGEWTTNFIERKTEPTISKMEQVETMSCAECKHRPIGAEICEEPCHYEPQTDWHYDEQDATWYPYKHEDEPQTMLNDGTLVINVEDATKVGRVLVGDDKNRGDLYYPDDEDEPQTCSVSGRPYSECADCEHFRCTADEPQTERSNDAE